MWAQSPRLHLLNRFPSRWRSFDSDCVRSVEFLAGGEEAGYGYFDFAGFGEGFAERRPVEGDFEFYGAGVVGEDSYVFGFDIGRSIYRPFFRFDLIIVQCVALSLSPFLAYSSSESSEDGSSSAWSGFVSGASVGASSPGSPSSSSSSGRYTSSISVASTSRRSR